METFNKDNIENGMLICNKNEQHRSLIELLFESKKRTGGDDIKQLYFDKSLNQYLIVYLKNETLNDVFKHGATKFNNDVYMPIPIDRTKVILENIDDSLKDDTLYMYADYLFQDTIKSDIKITHLKPGFVLIDIGNEYDVELVQKRYAKHGRLQNREIIFHLVAKIDDSDSSPYSASCLDSVTSNKTNNAKTCVSSDKRLTVSCCNHLPSEAKSCSSLVLIQDSDEEHAQIHHINFGSSKTDSTISSPRSSFLASSTDSDSNANLDALESKLRVYENMLENLKSFLETSMGKSNSKNTTTKLFNSPSKPTSVINNNNNNNCTNIPTPSTLIVARTKSQPEQRASTGQDLLTIKINRFPVTNENATVLNSSNASSSSPSPSPSPSPPESPTIKPGCKVKSTPSNLIRVRDSIQKFLVEEHRRFDQTLANGEESINNILPTSKPPTTKITTNRFALIRPASSAQTIKTPNRALTSSSANRASVFTSQLSRLNCTNNTRLSLSMINQFPIIKYKKPLVKKSSHDFSSESETGENENFAVSAATASATVNNSTVSCSICLEPLLDNQEVRLLSCFHQFHVECIDTWLMEKSTCPTCKFNLASTFNNDSLNVDH